jgi:hypothetical protein
VGEGYDFLANTHIDSVKKKYKWVICKIITAKVIDNGQ